MRSRLIKYLTAAVFACLLALPLSASADTPAGDEPAAAASRFVALLDAGDIYGAWHQLTPLARIVKPQEPWQNLHQALRTAYGPLEQRTLRGVTLQNRYTMLPDGRFAIVQFDTSFDNKQRVIETVVLVLAEDGRWLVQDYVLY